MTALFAPVERPEASKRRDPNLTEKLASALAELTWLRGDPIPIEHLRQMSAEQICSLFEWDHARRVHDGGDNHPLNLTPRFPEPHGEKTAKIDVPQIRKGQRLAAAQDEHHERMRAKIGTPEPQEREASCKAKQRRRWPKRSLESGNSFEYQRRKKGLSPSSPKASSKRKWRPD